MMRREAFTLTELLIVVAIIGILAAIAVPNFVNAQIRAKISRTYADLKALSTAVEMNRVDRNVLLVDGYDQELEWGTQRIEEVFDGVGQKRGGTRGVLDILAPLTTPVPYLSSIPTDPFYSMSRSQHAIEAFPDVQFTPDYIYVDEDPEDPEPDHIGMRYHPDTAAKYGNRPLLPGEYFIFGTGPDGVYYPEDLSQTWDLVGVPYDASNGLTSWGDLLLKGGGAS